jgi:hypothetical protein
MQYKRRYYMRDPRDLSRKELETIVRGVQDWLWCVEDDHCVVFWDAEKEWHDEGELLGGIEDELDTFGLRPNGIEGGARCSSCKGKWSDKSLSFFCLTGEKLCPECVEEKK